MDKEKKAGKRLKERFLTESDVNSKIEESMLRTNEEKKSDSNTITLKEMLRQLKRKKHRIEKRIKAEELKKEKRQSLIKVTQEFALDTSRDLGVSFPPISTENRLKGTLYESAKQKLKFLYGFGVSEFQSSSSLRNSVHSISFAKSERTLFKMETQPQPQPKANHAFLSIDSPKNFSNEAKTSRNSTQGKHYGRIKGVSMGIGSRIGCVSDLKLKEEAKLPGPGQYNLEMDRKSLTSRNKRKLVLPNIDDRFKTTFFDIPMGDSPGPAKYDISFELGKESKKRMIFNLIKKRLENNKEYEDGKYQEVN